MRLSIVKKFVRVIATILIVSVLVSCSASEHAGVTYKQRPAMTENNENVWFAYWEDQFDAQSGRVVAPPMEYPAVARSAYGRAQQEWNMKVQDAAANTSTAYIVTAAAITVITLILVWPH
jgi:hypothetical protein